MQETSISHAFEIKQAGDYRLVLEQNLRGDFVYVSQRAQITVSIDDRQVSQEEYGWASNHDIEASHHVHWEPGSHTIAIALKPAAQDQAKPRGAGEDNVYNLKLVRLEGPLNPAQLFVVRGELYEKRLRHVQDPSRQAELLAPAARRQHQLAPAVGTGSGTFLEYGREFHGPEVQADPQHVHNEYLELRAEYGWTGVGLLGGLLLAHLRAAIGGVRRVLDQKLKPTAWTASNELALLAGACCALTLGLAFAARDFTFHLPANALLAAFLLAILANPTAETAGRRERRPLPRPLAWLAPAIAALLFLLSAARFPSAVLAERARLALRDRDYPAARDLAGRARRGDPASVEACYLAGEALRYLALEADQSGRAAEWL